MFLVNQGIPILASPETRAYLSGFAISTQNLLDAGQVDSLVKGMGQDTRQMLGVDEDGSPKDGGDVLGLIVVNLRPVEEFGPDEIYRAMDVANAVILRLAVKSPETTIVLVDPDDYQEVVDRLARGFFPVERRRELAAKALKYQSEYDAAISDAMTRGNVGERSTVLLSAVDPDELPPEVAGMSSEDTSGHMDPSFDVVDQLTELHNSPTAEYPNAEHTDTDGSGHTGASTEIQTTQVATQEQTEAPSDSVSEPGTPSHSDSEQDYSQSGDLTSSSDNDMLEEMPHTYGRGLIIAASVAAVLILAGGWWLLYSSDSSGDLPDPKNPASDAGKGSSADNPDSSTRSAEMAKPKSSRKVPSHEKSGQTLALSNDEISSKNRLIKNALTENRNKEVTASCPECVRKGTMFLAKDRYGKAIEWYEKALEKTPDDPFVLTLLSLAYHGARKDKKALETAHRALEKNPNSLWAMLVIGTTCMMVHPRDYVCAVKYFERYLKTAPQGHPYRREIKTILKRLRPMAERQLRRKNRKK